MNRIMLLAGASGLSLLLAGQALAQTDLSMWYHGAGNPVERDIIIGIIDDFNASQADWKVNLQEFPRRPPTTIPSPPLHWRATCPISSTWTAPTCPTGRGRAIFSR